MRGLLPAHVTGVCQDKGLIIRHPVLPSGPAPGPSGFSFHSRLVTSEECNIVCEHGKLIAFQSAFCRVPENVFSLFESIEIDIVYREIVIAAAIIRVKLSR